MVGDDDSDIAIFQFGDNVLDVLDGDRVDSGEWLIEEDEFRVDGEGAGDFAAAALTSGKLDAEALADLVEVEFINQGLEALLPFFLGVIGHLHYGHQIVLHREFPEDGGLLSEVADAFLGPLVHRKSGDFFVIEENSAAVRNDKTSNHIKTGGFAGTVRPKEAHNLSLLHFHGNAFHNCSLAVFLDKVFSP